jgi:hypothetical protein
MHKVVDFLLNKIPPTNTIDFRVNAFVSLEGQACAYIYTALYVMFFYEPLDQNQLSSHDFSIHEWIEIMQNHLANVNVDTFGW